MTRGGPGGRAFFAVMPPADESSLGWFCSLARALGLRLDIALDPEPYPAHWGIELSPSTQQRDRWPFTVLPLGEEILDRRTDLPLDLWDLSEGIPTSQPLQAPRHLGPPLESEDDAELAQRLLEWAAWAPAWVTLSPQGWTVRRLRQAPPDGLEVAGEASGATLAEALAQYPDDW